MQLSVKAVVFVSDAVDSVPETGLAPDHAPDGTLDAVHESTFADDHDSVTLLPVVTAVLLELSDTVGVGTGGTVGEIATVTVRVTEPPAPVQASAKLLKAESGPVDSLPAVPFAPDQSSEAVQEVAPVDDQVSMDDPPFGMLVGLALKETVGAATVSSDPPPLPAAPPPQAVSMPANNTVAKMPGNREDAARIVIQTEYTLVPGIIIVP